MLTLHYYHILYSRGGGVVVLLTGMLLPRIAVSQPRRLVMGPCYFVFFVLSFFRLSLFLFIRFFHLFIFLSLSCCMSFFFISCCRSFFLSARSDWAPDLAICVCMCMCVYVCVCVYEYVYVIVYVYVVVYVYVYVYVRV